MTKENCVRLLNLYETIGRKEAYEDMKQHILKGNKWTDEERNALFKKEDSKKSK